MGINVTGRLDDRIVDVKINGDLTAATVVGIKREMHMMLDRYDTFCMDFSGIKFIDEAGYKFISNLKTNLFFNGKSVRMSNYSNEIVRSFNEHGEIIS